MEAVRTYETAVISIRLGGANIPEDSDLYGLKVFENWVMRMIGRKRYEVAGIRENLHNEAFIRRPDDGGSTYL
jgi:hypothetical protein